MIKNHIINTRNRGKTYWVEVEKKGGGYLPLTSKNKRWHLNSRPENKKHLKTHCWNNVDICQKFEANTHNVLSKQILMWTTLCIWLKHMYSCTRQHTHTHSHNHNPTHTKIEGLIYWSITPNWAESDGGFDAKCTFFLKWKKR